jgi:hypothetical protein
MMPPIPGRSSRLPSRASSCSACCTCSGLVHLSCGRKHVANGHGFGRSLSERAPTMTLCRPTRTASSRRATRKAPCSRETTLRRKAPMLATERTAMSCERTRGHCRAGNRRRVCRMARALSEVSPSIGDRARVCLPAWVRGTPTVIRTCGAAGHCESQAADKACGLVAVADEVVHSIRR